MASEEGCAKGANLSCTSETPKGDSRRGFPEVNLASDDSRRRMLDALLHGAGTESYR